MQEGEKRCVCHVTKDEGTGKKMGSTGGVETCRFAVCQGGEEPVLLSGAETGELRKKC
jgi:hypothetical protein